MDEARRYLPKTPTDWGAFGFLLFSINSIFFYGLFVMLPFYKELHPDFLYYTHLVTGTFIYINTLANLYKVMTTDTSIRGLMMPVQKREGWRFCTVCECNAPPRSFHCFTCKTCLLKRDHHCNFTGNCIGYRNQRFYITLVFYMWLAAIYANVMNIDHAYHVFGEFSLKTLFIVCLPMMAFISGSMHSISIIGALMTTLFLIGILLTSALFGYHVINISRGQIVCERTHKVFDYDIGLKGNIQSVLGKRWYIAWICPFISSPLPGDGIEFPKKGIYETPKNL